MAEERELTRLPAGENSHRPEDKDAYMDPQGNMFQECHDQYSDLSFRYNHKLHSNFVPLAAIQTGVIGPAHAAFNRFGAFEYIDPEFEDLYSGKVVQPSHEEVMNAGDQRFTQDLSFMPSKFETPEKALDTWNELGYPYKM